MKKMTYKLMSGSGRKTITHYQNHSLKEVEIFMKMNKLTAKKYYILPSNLYSFID